MAAFALLAVVVVATWLAVNVEPRLALVAFLGGVVGIWLLIYWIRLSCEFIIVVFDMAETMAEIRDDLRDRP